MINCQNCGHKSHCGNPLRKSTYSVPRSGDDALQEIEICKQCRCEKCSDISYKKAPFTFHDQSNWDWK